MRNKKLVLGPPQGCPKTDTKLAYFITSELSKEVGHCESETHFQMELVTFWKFTFQRYLDKHDEFQSFVMAFESHSCGQFLMYL